VLGAWDEHHSEAEDYRELDDGRVLVLSRNSARGKTSEADIATHVAIVFHVQDDRVTRLVLYWDRDHALSDLGLEE
jgi:ketosteroid isomerase-like protein